jgi:membrane-bound serine protease (ClpP class)
MMLAVALTLAGFVLVVAEVFFPSLGTLAIASAACLVAADVVAYEVSPGWMWALIAVQLVGVPFLLKGAFTVLPKLPFGRGMILPAPPAEAASAVEASDHLLGRAGTALTDLRPSGTAEFGDERRTVVAESGSVDRGSPVRVVAVEGYRIVVRAGSGAS